MPTALETFPAITGKNTGEAAKRSGQEMGNCIKPFYDKASSRFAVEGKKFREIGRAQRNPSSSPCIAMNFVTD
jgi:hypothetical protein